MKKYCRTFIGLVFTMFFFFPYFSSGQSGWTNLPTGYTSSLWNVKFLNQNVGFLAALSGQILKTTNGGLNWTEKYNSGGNSMLTISPVDFNNMYISATNGVYKTTNNGENWLRTLPTGSFLYACYFTNVNNGYSAGPVNKFYRSTDAGANWVETSSGVSFFAISFIGATTGFGVGSTSVMRTTDGGATWDNVHTASGALRDIYFCNTTVGYAVGSSVIIKTTNSGSTWFSCTCPSLSYNGVHFFNTLTGYVCGDNSTIVKTTDGGSNWSIQSIPDAGIILNDVYAISNDTAYLCGTSGNLYKTVTGGVYVDIKEYRNVDVPAFELYQNFPNPFKKSTSIKYLLKESSTVCLKILDIKGREIAILVSAKQTAGNYEINYKNTNLASGIYYISLSDGKHTITKKMVIE
jgi:photosystem II stability/assembly factor-like uncharacterized protein